MAATVIEMPRRESDPPPRRNETFDLLIGSAVWIGGGLTSALISAMTFYLIGHWVVVIARHFHHQHL